MFLVFSVLMTNFILFGCLEASSFCYCLASFWNYFLALWSVLLFWHNSHIVELTNWPRKYFWQICIYFKDKINYSHENAWAVFDRTIELQHWKSGGFSVFKWKKKKNPMCAREVTIWNALHSQQVKGTEEKLWYNVIFIKVIFQF